MHSAENDNGLQEEAGQKSATRKDGKVDVTVTVPKAKVKKLGNVKKVTVAYGSTNNNKKFEAKKVTVKATKKGSSQYTFTIKNKKLNSYKVAYISVQLGNKSNWSKLVKVSGSASKPRTMYWIKCNTKGCDFYTESYNGMDELYALFNKHSEEMSEAWWDSFEPEGPTEDDILSGGLHLGFSQGSVTSYSN